MFLFDDISQFINKINSINEKKITFYLKKFPY